MKKYHKIKTVFNRNPDTRYKTVIPGSYSMPEFDYLKNNIWTFTEKVDGTNIRVMYDGQSISFGGKTNSAQLPSSLLNRLNDMFVGQKNLFQSVFDGPECSVCFYGEGYGAKIQKGGGNYGQTQEFVLFDIKIGNWWLRRTDVEDIAKQFHVDIVPEIGCGTLEQMVVKTRDGFDSVWGTFRAEGIVARPPIELQTRSGHRIITKIKCKDFEA